QYLYITHMTEMIAAYHLTLISTMSTNRQARLLGLFIGSIKTTSQAITISGMRGLYGLIQSMPEYYYRKTATRSAPIITETSLRTRPMTIFLLVTRRGSVCKTGFFSGSMGTRRR